MRGPVRGPTGQPRGYPRDPPSPAPPAPSHRPGGRPGRRVPGKPHAATPESPSSPARAAARNQGAIVTRREKAAPSLPLPRTCVRPPTGVTEPLSRRQRPIRAPPLLEEHRWHQQDFARPEDLLLPCARPSEPFQGFQLPSATGPAPPVPSLSRHDSNAPRCAGARGLSDAVFQPGEPVARCLPRRAGKRTVLARLAQQPRDRPDVAPFHRPVNRDGPLADVAQEPADGRGVAAAKGDRIAPAGHRQRATPSGAAYQSSPP